MPEYLSFIVSLKAILPESAWSRVINALRQDELVWESLQEPDFGEKALATLGDRPAAWSPASLAFLALEQPLPSSGAPLDPLLRQRALRAYEALLRQGAKGSVERLSLSQAALLAITLAEHHALSGSWEDLPADLRPVPKESPAFGALWRTPLAILYGLASDPLNLLRSLARPGAARPLKELALHALLSNPLPATEQGQALAALLRDMPLAEAGEFLAALERSRPEQATRLARRLAGRQATLPIGRRPATSREQLGLIGQALASAELHVMAAQPFQATSLHRLALEQARGLQLSIAAQLAGAAAACGEIDAALSIWRSVFPEFDGATPPVPLAIGLVEAGRQGEALALFPDSQPSSPLHLVVTAHFAAAGSDPLAARDCACQALKAIEELHEPLCPAADHDPQETPHLPAEGEGEAETPGEGRGERFQPAALQRANLHRMARSLVMLLLDLSLPGEAARAARLALRIQPNDPGLLALLSQCQRLSGESLAAIEAAHLAAALDPVNPALRRELAAGLEQAGDWRAALDERIALLGARFAPPSGEAWPLPADWRALACCALKAGEPERAIQACQSALEIDPEDGLAHAVLGEALTYLGRSQEAMEHFRRATQQAPHQALPWLSLARAQQATGESARAIETLQAATHAVPTDPSILLALAEAYLAENSSTEAVGALRRAYELASLPRSALLSKAAKPGRPEGHAWDSPPVERGLASRIALLLGQTLCRQGLTAEARQVLERAYQAHASYPGLAYAYARTLLDLGEERAALAPLVVAVNAEPKEIEPYLDYAQALLSARIQPEEAVRVLRHALELAEAPAKSPASGQDESVPGDSQPAAGTPAAEQASAAGAGGSPAGKEQQPTGAETAQGLLADALAANGELEEALRAYYRALDTRLASQPAWRARLSLGLGLVALALGQPETAIAALQEACRADPNEPRIPRALCEAYASLQLPKEALESARSAVQLAPDDVETLTWFAKQALRLGASDEAIPCLTRAVELAPQEAGLSLRLGQVQAQYGEEESAVETFRSVLDLAEAQPEHLRQAAAGLLSLGEARPAIACLERALAQAPAPTTSLLGELAAAHRQAGDLDRALEILNQSIELDPNDPALHLSKADLLVSLERLQAAQACLEHALNLHPADPDVHARLAAILRSRGELVEALSRAEQLAALFADRPEEPQGLAARALAAGLARALLQCQYARQMLGDLPGEEVAVPASPAAGQVSASPGASGLSLQAAAPANTDLADQQAYYCLYAELALDQEEEVAAANALARAGRLAPPSRRVLALQARLSNRRGDAPTALQLLHTALESAGAGTPSGGADLAARAGGAAAAQPAEPSAAPLPANAEAQPPVDDLYAIAWAALELAQWEPALSLLRRAAGSAPAEPFGHLQLARALALRAEHQRLCQSLESVAHAPGAEAISAQAWQDFQEAIQLAQRCLPEPGGSPSSLGGKPPLPAELLRWRARGQAVFLPEKGSLEALAAFVDHPEDRAAYVAGLSHLGDLVSIAQLYKANRGRNGDGPEHPLVLAQFALSLGFKGRRQEDLSEAIASARAAVERQPHQPLFHVLLARLSHNEGDSETAWNAMQAALALWPDEPRWHAQAAGLQLAAGDPSAAIEHLNRAVALEPGYLGHHLALGEAYRKAGDADRAIRAFEQALRLAPKQAEPYLALAQAYLSQGDLARAASSAEGAISVAPDQAAPLLLRAEIALRADDPRGAQKRVEIALRMKPDDPTALHVLARTQALLGRRGEALATLEKAIPLAAEPLPLLLERIRLLEKQQGAESSLAALQQLAERYPEEPSVLAMLAVSQAAAGQTETATRTAQRALRGAAALEPVQQASLHHLLGRLLRQAGQLDQAVHHLSEAARLAPTEVEAFLELGGTHQERRQYSLALQNFQKAIAVAPADPRPYYQASLALKASRDYQGAESMLRRAAELAPNDLAIHRQLAALVALNLVHNRRPIPVEQ